MATRRQQTLSPSSSSRLASGRLTASQSRAGQPVRWGSAVVEPTRRSTSSYWTTLNDRPRRERRAPVCLQGALSFVPGGQDSVGGPGGVANSVASVAPVEVRSFTQNRIRHAFELFGACMMIVTFLAMAMFV
jgi:hypothetical protein